MAENVLFVTDSDSNVTFATAFGAHLARTGVASDIVLVADGAALLVQSGAAVGAGHANIQVVAALETLFADDALLGYDVIFVLITGRLVRDFCVDLNLLALSRGAAKPVTIGGFIGEWISGEAQVEERGALDLFVVNRDDELGLFAAICARGGHDGGLVALPYGFLVRHGFAKPLPPTFAYDLSTTILFADQVQVPRTDAERLSLYEGLEALAKASPNRKILFCTREVAGGVTSHRAKGDITDHFSPERLAGVPNLIVERGTLRRRLAEAQLVLSVSSTAGVEALINGVPALFLRGFSDSGAEKFENSGLLVDLAELRRPTTFTPTSAFYAAASRSDVWDAFAELVRGQPTRASVTAPGKPVLPRSTVVPGSASSLLEERLRRTPGVSNVEALPGALAVAPLDLAASLAALNGAPADYVAQLAVSDTPRLAPATPSPTLVATTIEGYEARAETGLGARDVALHVPARLGAGDEIVVAIGRTEKMVGRHDGDAVAFSGPGRIAASVGHYATTAGDVSVIRLCADEQIDVRSVTLSRPAGALPPAWIGFEPRRQFTRLGIVAPTLKPERVAIAPSDRNGRVVALRFERHDVSREGPLFTFDDGASATLAIAGLRGGALSLELLANGEVMRAQAATGDGDTALTVISAPSRTIVVANGWTHVFPAAFQPTGLSVDAPPEFGLSAPAYAAFGATFADEVAARLAERVIDRCAAAAPVAPSAASAAETSRVLGSYLDLVGADDLVAAMAVVDGLRSPLAYAERYLRAGDHAKAFAVSAICADRTPTSKAHLLICAEALGALGAADRAETFLRRAEQLAPQDHRVKATAALVRGRTSGVRGKLRGLVGALRRVTRPK